MVLLFAFPPATPTIAGVARALASGLPRDLFAGLLQTIPLLLWLLMIPDKKFSARWHRVSLIAVSFIAAFVQIFLLFAEFFFFEEFRSRFNTVAVDYLLYPKEVFVNIWESYHVALFLASPESGFITGITLPVEGGAVAAGAYMVEKYRRRKLAAQ